MRDRLRTFYRYLDRWSDPRTWLNEEVPGDGDSVYVPDGQAILVDESSPMLKLVVVDGVMVFDQNSEKFGGSTHRLSSSSDVNANTPGANEVERERRGEPSLTKRKPLTFDATWFWVHGGTVEIGTKYLPYEKNDLVITMHGDKWKTVELPYVGAKMLAVSNVGNLGSDIAE